MISYIENKEPIALEEIPLRIPEKIQLTSLNQEKKYFTYIDARFLQNITRAGIAGGLSTIGGYLSGFIPTTAGIIGGAILSGMGNGLSTGLTWEGNRDKLIEARILTDFPKIAAKISLIEKQLIPIIDKIEELHHQEPSSIEEPKNPWYWSTKERRNTIRILSAGTLSAAGGLCSGLWPTVPGILIGGALSGIGNIVSTWLSFEKETDSIIRQSALEILPQLLQDMKITEDQLNNVIEEPSLEIKESEEEPNLETDCELLKTRDRRNFTYVNVAGWMSAFGSLLPGLIHNQTSIIAGSVIGGAANMISTWLMWENVNDRKIERIVLKEFPPIIAKMGAIKACQACENKEI